MAEHASTGMSLVPISPGPLAANKKRPPILKRTSRNLNSPQSTNTSNSSAALLGSPRKERVTVELPEPKSEAVPMAAAFLQYCAMCEKQITTPCNSILYCSEACRRKDSLKPLSAATITYTSTSSTPSNSTPSSPRAILLPPRLPTGVIATTNTSETISFIPSIRIPSDDHGFKSDLDPTEWKPKLRPGRSSHDRHSRTGSRHNSEAFRYLQSFHRAINKDDGMSEEGIRIDVPSITASAILHGGFAGTATEPPTPSLGNTPTTTASSSSWSVASAGADTGLPGYDFNTRPLMPRHNRWYSTSSVGGYGYGIDLVTPHIPPPTENAYAKKDVKRQSNSSGLGAFFGAGGGMG